LNNLPASPVTQIDVEVNPAPRSASVDGWGQEDRRALASAFDWWIGAGVDTLVDEAPRDWLAKAAPPPAAPAGVPEQQPPAALPASLPELHGWLATTDALPGDPPRTQRLAPVGDPASGLMIVLDMPEDADAEAGVLLGGEAGLLFDRMLAAIGRGRESVYIAPLAPARAPGGRIEASTGKRLAEIMRHHIRLANPRAVLTMGDEAAFALLGARVPALRAGLRDLYLDGGTVAAIATFHPRFLLRYPARKADAWTDLRLLMGALRP
jgi:uracil-DNA glycosylase